MGRPVSCRILPEGCKLQDPMDSSAGILSATLAIPYRRDSLASLRKSSHRGSTSSGATLREDTRARLHAERSLSAALQASVGGARCGSSSMSPGKDVPFVGRLRPQVGRQTSALYPRSRGGNSARGCAMGSRSEGHRQRGSGSDPWPSFPGEGCSGSQCGSRGVFGQRQRTCGQARTAPLDPSSSSALGALAVHPQRGRGCQEKL
mmetsp:Transcript_5196/g.9379  ORF Transcript_5196/g.9379 Transcript_5196/m.9379 type:complete len:205 (+) Transcript_5196:438-1052(+)